MTVAVVGAGPAGTRAVEVLVRAGQRPVWIDEAPANGGRIYQRPLAGTTRSHRDLYGTEAAKAAAIHALGDRLRDASDWRPGTLVWNLRPGLLDTFRAGRHEAIRFERAILCTGAMDRIVPVPGWTLPGVFTLGGAQIALKAQGAAIGARVAFLGTGPLLWLVAAQYVKAGASVALVLDTSPFATKARATAGLLRDATTFAKGLALVARLRLAGVRVIEGGAPIAIEGTDAVAAVRVRDRAGREHRIACDAVGLGFGLKPESQLADLAGVPFTFDGTQRNWVPQHDGAGRTQVPRIYLAGDAAGIAGADAAELAGARAAWAAIADGGAAVDIAEVARLARVLARIPRFRAALERAFPYPAVLAARTPDATIVCRCEAITAGELRAAARESHVMGRAPEVNRAKAFTRVGMGRCQGRVCGPPAAEILADALGCDVAEVGRLRGQSPVKPIPILALAAE
ncbi:FAD-dependent oxidoreductase [Elioraea sp.]|uniref:FAD/NAD(P)-dependent oxidoreductase n=1 Tax=Elioraea sp. TaxID=2185103 RepID=UPI003F70C26B